MSYKIFLSKTSNISIIDKVDIILSPELYWVRVFDIPIVNKNEALKVVPTLFEDFLEIEKYKFYIDKIEENKYICFAYDEELLIKTIEDANLNLSQILNMYFAQHECVKYKTFKVRDEYFLYDNNILVKVPKQFIDIESIEELEVNSITLSAHKIYIDKTNQYIDNKSIYILSSIFLIISLINFTKSIGLNNQINQLSEQKINITKEYKIPSTMFELKSIIKTLERKDDKQIKIRNDIQNILGSTKKRIKKMYLNNGSISYE